MTSEISTLQASATPLWRELLPVCTMVFLEFLAMGLPLPVLPLHVNTGLGFGSFTVGLVIGAQSWATLLTRHAAGTRTDQKGPRSATLAGLVTSSVAGVLYAVSTAAPSPAVALAVLVLGRVLLGIGESLVITGALAWGVALAGRERSGVVMAWVGVAMYGALAVGAPLGTRLQSLLGFAGMSGFAALAPALGLIALASARGVAPLGGVRLPFYRVLGLIAWPGAGLATAALGFGAIAAFSTLRFNQQGWSHAPLAMTAFGAAYVLARVLFADLPDRFGGARIAMLSAAVAALGQLALWLASTAGAAVAAAAVTGLGFSLAFPAFGVEAIRRVPPQNRGVALGAYAACFDITLGLGVPLLGAVAGAWSYAAVFAVGGIAALVALGIAAGLSRSTAGRTL